jgi:hypothetical protein
MYRKYKEPHCFMFDDQGLCYIIPVNLRNMFDDMQEAAYDNGIDEEAEVELHKEFGKYRALHPVNYMFTEIETLSEKNTIQD